MKQEMRVKKNADGAGIIEDSDEYVEHMFQLLKQIQANHCNNKDSWLLHTGTVMDVISLGTVHHGLSNLYNLEKLITKQTLLLKWSKETEKRDQKLLAAAAPRFQEYVKRVQNLSFGSNSIHEKVSCILNNGNDPWWEEPNNDDVVHVVDNMHGNVALIEHGQLVAAAQEQVVDTYAEDYDPLIDEVQLPENVDSNVMDYGQQQLISRQLDHILDLPTDPLNENDPFSMEDVQVITVHAKQTWAKRLQDMQTKVARTTNPIFQET